MIYQKKEWKLQPSGKQLRGLALLSPEKRKEIATKGGYKSKRGKAKK